MMAAKVVFDRGKVGSAAFALVALVACAVPPTSGPEESNSIQANGATAKMVRVEGAPLYNLEAVGEVVNPLSRGSVTLPLAGQFTATGWALDQATQALAGGVDVAVDDRPYAAEYGADRIDVAEHFGKPELLKTGFKLSIPAAAIGKGRHDIRVRVVTPDGTQYREGSSLALVIE